MKRTVLLLSAIAFFLTFSTVSFGQSISTEANVIQSLTFTPDGAGVQFGDIPSDLVSATNPSLDPSTGNPTGIIGGTYDLGYILVTGSGSQEIQVTWTGTSDLDDASGDGSNLIEYAPSVCLDSGDTSAQSACSGSTVITNGTSGGTVNLNSGNATIWIGGSLTDKDGTGTLPTGAHTGSQTFTVDYTFAS